MGWPLLIGSNRKTNRFRTRFQWLDRINAQWYLFGGQSKRLPRKIVSYRSRILLSMVSVISSVYSDAWVQPLLWKLELLRDISVKLGCRIVVLMYEDGIALLLSDTTAVPIVASILKEYEVIANAKLNPNKSVGLRLGTWRSTIMPSNNRVDRWTEMTLDILLGSDIQVNKNCDEVTCWVTSITQK